MKNNKTTKKPLFIADCHLGKLAKYLRFMGFDTLYFPQIDDNDLIELANKDGRIILTRDRELSERKKAHCVLLKSVEMAKQLQEIVIMFDLQKDHRSISRCIVCNEPLVIVDKEEVLDRLPAKVIKYFSHFEVCKSCERIYWHGDHYKRMKAFLEKILDSV